jgi:large subunit ribosomal protein L7/L12
MAEETATVEVAPELVEVAPELKELGDKIADLTLKQAIELSDYLKDEHSIEPAAGGGVVMAAAGGGAGAEEVEQTEFDVVLTGFGDKKLNVVKEVKAITGATLMEAKKMVEDLVTIKEKVDKEEAEKVKAQLEEAGASVELK